MIPRGSVLATSMRPCQYLVPFPCSSFPESRNPCVPRIIRIPWIPRTVILFRRSSCQTSVILFRPLTERRLWENIWNSGFPSHSSSGGGTAASAIPPITCPPASRTASAHRRMVVPVVTMSSRMSTLLPAINSGSATSNRFLSRAARPLALLVSTALPCTRLIPSAFTAQDCAPPAASSDAMAFANGQRCRLPRARMDWGEDGAGTTSICAGVCAGMPDMPVLVAWPGMPVLAALAAAVVIPLAAASLVSSLTAPLAASPVSSLANSLQMRLNALSHSASPWSFQERIARRTRPW